MRRIPYRHPPVARGHVQRFWAEDAAATAVEYGLIIGLVAAVLVAALVGLGDSIKNIFGDIAGIFANRT